MGFWIGSKAFDRTMVVLSAWFVFGAYLDASSRVGREDVSRALAPWQEVAAEASWFLILALLLVALWRNLGRGRPWPRALPRGYLLPLVAALAFGLTVILDIYWERGIGFGVGLQALLAPTHLVEIITGGLIVAGPLRAAILRQEPVASLAAMLSATLVASVLSFATLFAHPLVDLWAANGARQPVPGQMWPAQDLGASALVIQLGMLISITLYLLRHFHLRPGSLTLLFGVNGALVVVVKAHVELLPVAIATGVVADFLLWRLRPSIDNRRGLRLFATAVPATYSTLYLVALGVSGGLGWSLATSSGLILLTATEGWLLSHLAMPGQVHPGTAAVPGGEHDQLWSPGLEGAVNPQQVKTALEGLADNAVLSVSPLTQLHCISTEGPAAGAEVRTLLIEVIRELAVSRTPRDAEAGQLLNAYYVRRSGSHEVVAEQLHLSRPTFYRRLQHGLNLVAERVDRLSDLALRDHLPGP